MANTIFESNGSITTSRGLRRGFHDTSSSNPEDCTVGKVSRSTGQAKVGRVPETFQTIWAVANRGKDVNKPPPNKVASRFFGRHDSKQKGSSASSVASGQSRGRNSSTLTQRSSSNKRGLFGRGRSESTSRRRSVTPTGRRERKQPEDFTITVAADAMPEPDRKHHVSPKTYFESVLKTRGYSTKTFRATKTAYYNHATELQKASHGVKYVQALRTKDTKTLREMLEAGLSPNACNDHSESIVHMTCRLGHTNVLKLLLEFGCNVQVVDDYGRNPLHDACWSTETNFDVVDVLLGQDKDLLRMEDNHGAVPLAYLKDEQWTKWTKYIMSRKDKFWPDRDVVCLGIEADPPLAMQDPHTRPIADTGIDIQLAKMVTTGRMTALEAILMREDDDDDDDSGSEYDSSEEDSEFDDSDYVEYDSESEFGFDESEMQAVLGSLCCLGKKGGARALAWSS